MAKDNKVRMPSSMAGITTYYDNATAKVVLTPKQVMVIIGVVIVLVLAMHIAA